MKRMYLIFLCLTPLVLADIESGTSITRVSIPGSDQHAGEIALIVDSDEFPTASVHHPVHIRIGLEEGVTLSETLVGPREPAILLPIRIRSGNGLMVAPPDAVSIVRWRAGESAFWLRVTAPTSTWLEVDGVTQAPSEDNTVLMFIGKDAASSRDTFEDYFLEGKANLPASQQGCDDAGSEIVLDLGPDLFILISYVPSAFQGGRGNLTTRAPEHAINAGHPYDLIIYGDFFIAAKQF